MSPGEGRIQHVSDTALMVAACRAMETARPDGLLHDPFAARLAGARGTAIANSLPGLPFLCFGVGVRVCFLDNLVTQLVGDLGVRTVLSIGCGLDTRPWRMALPAGLRWIEVDFPEMLEYKASHMRGEAPHCRLEQIPADLNDPAARREVFAAASDAASAVITEGLLTYLPAGSDEALADDARTSGLRYWLLDVNSREMSAQMSQGLRAMEDVRSPEALDGKQILEVLQRNGWKTLVHRSYTRDSVEVAEARIKAIIEASRQPGAPPRPPPLVDDPSGVYLCGKS